MSKWTAVWSFWSYARVETEGASKIEDNEINPKADSHPGTNQA